MKHKNHREVDVQENLKVVISKVNGKFDSIKDVDSAIEAIAMAGRTSLGLTRNITGMGTLLGNVMILNVYIPLSSSVYIDHYKKYDEFNRLVVDYLTRGVTNPTAYSMGRVGGFGALNVGYVSPTPSRKVRASVVGDEDSIREALKGIAEVGNVSVVD